MDNKSSIIGSHLAQHFFSHTLQQIVPKENNSLYKNSNPIFRQMLIDEYGKLLNEQSNLKDMITKEIKTN